MSLPLILAESSALQYLTQPWVAVWIGIAAAMGVPAVATAWHKTKVREEELRTAARLAEQGLSADEIERVLRCKSE